ncbi:MAG TPA: hypothetical protein VK203_27595 [Nostocaceae cyanobacterium]|nr:hypothetical protein [Nostocaceae cyanobacterium]
MKRDELGQFVTEGEARTEKLSLRIEPSIMKEIKNVPNWQDELRGVIYQWLKDRSITSSEFAPEQE